MQTNIKSKKVENLLEQMLSDEARFQAVSLLAGRTAISNHYLRKAIDYFLKQQGYFSSEKALHIAEAAVPELRENVCETTIKFFENRKAYKLAAEWARKLGDEPRVRKLIEQAIKENPKFTEDIYAGLGFFREATNYLLKKAKSERKKQAKELYRAAEYAKQAKNFKLAMRLYEKAGYINEAARIAEKQGAVDEIKRLNILLMEKCEAGGEDSLIGAGEYAQKADLAEKAREFFTRAIERYVSYGNYRDAIRLAEEKGLCKDRIWGFRREYLAQVIRRFEERKEDIHFSHLDRLAELFWIGCYAKKCDLNTVAERFLEDYFRIKEQEATNSYDFKELKESARKAGLKDRERLYSTLEEIINSK